MSGSDAGGRFSRYAALGIASNGFCYLLFLGLLAVKVPPIAANAICYAVGVTISYLGNRTWSFRSRNRHASDMLRFGAAYGLGLAVSIGSLALLLQALPATLAQLVTIGVTAVAIYAALLLFKFGKLA